MLEFLQAEWRSTASCFYFSCSRLKGMGKHDHCCVPNCTARRDDGRMRAFHHFPGADSDPELRKKWLIAIRRDEGPFFKVTSQTVVCSGHFLDGDYSGAIPPRTEEEIEIAKVSGCRHSYRLKRDAVPHYSDLEKQKLLSSRPPPRPRSDVPPPKKKVPKLTAEQEEIRDLKLALEETKQELERLRGDYAGHVEIHQKHKFSYASLREQCKTMDTQGDTAGRSAPASLFEFYTGLSPVQFDCLWEYLEPSEENIISAQQSVDASTRAKGGGPKSTLSLRDQLLMVLMRLRLGLLERDLAFRFDVSQSTVSRIFTKWINYLYLRLGMLPIWPSEDAVARAMPTCFKDTYPDTFVIVDATEIHVEVPSSLSLQSQNYSSYKSHTTHKGLLGIAPNGCITFVSELYTGSISDREITIDSGILNLLKSVSPGKAVMADRGFEIQDLLVATGHVLNIPPFRDSSGVLQQRSVINTQQIARLRIHVERVIGQVKRTFRILQGILPLSVEGCINQIWTVCCLLTNFKGPIIAE